MSEAIVLLQLEHRNADHLLKLIEEQQRGDAPADIGLLQDICTYFLDYPDQCHHPVEDRIYRKLLERDPAAGAKLSGLLEQHSDIANQTREFAAAVNRAAEHPRAGDRPLRDAMTRFVGCYRSHMIGEEKEFFPRALDALTDSDWTEVEHDLFDRRDPIFDHEAEHRFRRLREQIERDAIVTHQRAEHLRRARTLNSLTGVEAFNQFASAAGHAWRLVAHANGGYRLEHDGQVIIDIPKCDEIRAAWCAYYYLESRVVLPIGATTN